MKLFAVIVSLIISNAALADSPWLKKPAIYYYQEAKTIQDRVGTDEFIDEQTRKISDVFLTQSSKLKKRKEEKPFFLVVMFNDKGNVKFWIESEDEARLKEWETAAGTALKGIPFKTTEGSVAIAYYFGIVGDSPELPKNPPILKAWYEEIDKHQKIGASALFEQIMAQ